MFNNSPIERYFSSGVLSDLKGHKFEIENIRLLKRVNDYQCDVVIEDNKGFRSYKVKLEKNHRYTHLYKITDIQGQKLVSTYQWKDEL